MEVYNVTAVNLFTDESLPVLFPYGMMKRWMQVA